MTGRQLLRVIVVVALAGGLVGGGWFGLVGKPGAPRPVTAQPPPSSPAPDSPLPSPSWSVSSVPLVRWQGPVEHIFFHPLVVRPALAFRGDRLGIGFQHYFVTVHEFRGILRGLWHHGWTLVDAHRAATGHVRVPRGRKPLVLSEDDVNYYAYFDGRGLARRLALDDNGEVRAQVVDAAGRTHLTDQDLVPIVDAFVVRHPQFSAQGAKGLLGLTAYEGLLGYHHLGRPAERAHLRALVARLAATGWSFASHTYGHIDLSVDSLATIEQDTRRWLNVTRGLLPATDMLIYPFGARPTTQGMAYLRSAGFPIQFDIDIRPLLVHLQGVTRMSRRHIDGYAFQVPAQLHMFFSVSRILDPRRPLPVPP